MARVITVNITTAPTNIDIATGDTTAMVDTIVLAVIMAALHTTGIAAGITADPVTGSPCGFPNPAGGS